MPSIYLPQVIERSSRGERGYDIFSRLLLDRIIFLGTEIDDDVANLIIAQLLFLEADGPGKAIHLYINCPGGSVSAGLAIYDTMRYLESPVASARAHHDAPAVAVRSGAGRGGGHRDPGEGNSLHALEDVRAACAAHGAAIGANRTGFRSRQVDGGAGG